MQHGVEVCGPSWADNVDGINVPNLRKLSAYLKTLPDDYEHFDMFSFYAGPRNLLYDVQAVEHTCGTVACAIGHGISAGIPANGCITWWSYVKKNFIDIFHESAFKWMFSHAWKYVDNTPHGAAARIDWFLQHGVPNNWLKQIEGVDPLCYK